MPISEDELQDLIHPTAPIEKVSTISSDGKTFITRIPKIIVDELGVEKGDKLRWLAKEKSKKVELKLEKQNGSSSKKENN